MVNKQKKKRRKREINKNKRKRANLKKMFENAKARPFTEMNK